METMNGLSDSQKKNIEKISQPSLASLIFKLMESDNTQSILDLIKKYWVEDQVPDETFKGYICIELKHLRYKKKIDKLNPQQQTVFWSKVDFIEEFLGN